MAVTINASNTSGFILNSDTSGELQLQNNGATRMTVNSSGVSFAAQPLINGVAPPAFRAFLGSNQTVSTTINTKVTLTNETFDTASCFNNTGSTAGGIPAYAFLPNVAGYYQINANIGASSPSNLNYNYIQIRKNGLEDSRAIYGPYGAGASYGSVSNIIFLNGSTDYVELFVQLAGDGTLNALADFTIMSGCLVRAA
jgi:hypothetical protein